MPDDIFIDPPCALWPVGVDSPPERITIWPELPVSLAPDTNDNDPPFPATLDAPAFIRMLPVLLPVLDPVEIVTEPPLLVLEVDLERKIMFPLLLDPPVPV